MVLERPLTVKFSLRGLRGLKYEEVLEGLPLPIPHVQAVQLTYSNCLITLDNSDSKGIVKEQGLKIRGRIISVSDADVNIINVTIKDAPFELSNDFIFTHLMKYGDVIAGSMVHGIIKGTSIKTGTRYCKMSHIKEPIPNLTKFGEFNVRIFYDMPDQDRATPKRCFICNSTDHLQKDHGKSTTCENSGLVSQEKTDRAQLTMHGKQVHSTPVKLGNPAVLFPGNGDQGTVNPNMVVLGASNVKTMLFKDKDTIVVAQSGVGADQVSDLLDIFQDKYSDKKHLVNKAAIHLGTNDINRVSKDSDKVILRITSAVKKVQNFFPAVTEVGLCSVPPKRGSGANNDSYNNTVKLVNTFLKKYCESESGVSFIDNDPILLDQNGHAKKSHFKKDDGSGIHFNEAGRKEVARNIEEVMNPPSGFLCTPGPTNEKKRSHSMLSPDSGGEQEAKRPDVENQNKDESYV